MSTGGGLRRITRGQLRSNSLTQGPVTANAPGQGQNGDVAIEGHASGYIAVPTTKAPGMNSPKGRGREGVTKNNGNTASNIQEQRLAGKPPASGRKSQGKGGKKSENHTLKVVVSEVQQEGGQSEIVYKPSETAPQPVLLALEAPSIRQREKASLAAMGNTVGMTPVLNEEQDKVGRGPKGGRHKYVRMGASRMPNGGAKKNELQLVVVTPKGRVGEAPVPDERKGGGAKGADVNGMNNGLRRKSVEGGRGRGVKRGNMRKLDKGGGKVLEETGTGNLDRILRRIKHQLNRLRKEEFFLEVYGADGWKGSSKEKVRPVVEQNRAQNQVLQSKLVIRESMRELDLLTQQGAISDRAFDKEGRITHEQIFCARCESKNISSDNDIILCDGYCNRAFHQQCLNPPLMTEDIPPGDEGWLCPECDCKLECIYAIQSDTGTALGPSTTWEDIFPEVVDPGLQERDRGESGQAEGDVNMEVEWPSDESEDEDYNPMARDGPPTKAMLQNSAQEEAATGGSEQEEEEEEEEESESSDFAGGGEDTGSESSDDEELNEEILDRLKREGRRRVRGSTGGTDEVEVEPDGGRGPLVPDVDLTMEDDEQAVRSGKRRRTTVDYRKLHDEMFGAKGDDVGDTEEPMSEDEDWGPGTAKRRKKAGDGVNHEGLRPGRSKPKLATPGGAGEAVTPGPPGGKDALASSSSPPSTERRTGPGSRLPEDAKEVLRVAYVTARGVPRKHERDRLAALTGLNPRQVETWYRNFMHKNKDRAMLLLAQASKDPAVSPSPSPPVPNMPTPEATPVKEHDAPQDGKRKKRSSRIGADAKASPLTIPDTPPPPETSEGNGNAHDGKYSSRASARLRGHDAGVVVSPPQAKVYPLRAIAGRANATTPPAGSAALAGVTLAEGDAGGGPQSSGTEPVQAFVCKVRSRLRQLKSTLR